MEYGLIGEKLSHSFSRKIHGMLCDYDYALLELSPCAIGGFIESKNFKGLNVTIPYKKTVIQFLDGLGPRAMAVGAVNTIVNDNGKLVGYNTDYYGFTYMVNRAGIAVKDKIAAVLGTGGASNMAALALKDMGAKEVLVISRSGESNYEYLHTRADVNIIVNATPIGTYPNVEGCLVDLDKFPNLSGVLDLVYNPSVTELIFRAKKRGVKCANGLSMLVAQAARASELFTANLIPVEKIESVIERVEALTKNIVLVGMPGCGKTTVGKIVAEKTGREFIDTDVVFNKTYGVTAGEYIEKFGETAFRESEAKIVKEACIGSGKVIATGGGAVKREDNRKYINCNGVCVWIERDLSLLATANRPLSKTPEKLQTLYVERAPLYRQVSDFSVVAEYDAVKTANEIIHKIGL